MTEKKQDTGVSAEKAIAKLPVRPATGSEVNNRILAAFALAKNASEAKALTVCLLPNGAVTAKGEVKTVAVSPGNGASALADDDAEKRTLAFEELATKDVWPILIRKVRRVNAYGVVTETPAAVVTGEIVRTLAGIDPAKTARELALEKEALASGKAQQ